jgi:hypothetical protein
MAIRPSSAWNDKGSSATEKVDLSPLQETNRLSADGQALDIEYLVIKAGSAEHKGLEKLHSQGTIPANTVHLSLDTSDAGRLTVEPEMPFDKGKGGLVIVVDDGAIGLIAQDFSDRAQKNIQAHPDRKDAFYKPLLKGEVLHKDFPPPASEAERHQRIGEFVLASGEVGQNLIKALYPQAENTTLEGEASQTVTQMIGAEVAKRLDPVVGPAAPARQPKPSL